jgi:hypothetical protein
MKKPRFKKSEIFKILKEAESGTPVPERGAFPGSPSMPG